MQEETIILAIEIGGTKCEILAVDPLTADVVGSVRHQADELPPECRPKQFFGGIGRTEEMRRFCLKELIGTVKPRNVLLATNVVLDGMKGMLEEHGIAIQDSLYVGEIEGAFLSMDMTWGIAMASGTGTVGMVWMPDGSSRLIDGVGPMLGDWGSGYSIGLDFLRRAFREQESQNEPLEEMQRICAHLDCFSGTERKDDERPLGENYRRLGRLVNEYSDRSVIASLSRVCGDCATSGSALAIDVLQKAGRDLAESVIRASRRSGMDAIQGFPMVASGSVLLKNDIVFDAMKKRLEAELPQAKVIRAARPQVCGQVIGMLRKLHPTGGKAVIDHFFESYQKWINSEHQQ